MKLIKSEKSLIKIVVLLSTFFLIFMTFSGCGNNEEAISKAVEEALREAGVIGDVAEDEIKAEEKDLEVKIEKVSDELYERAETFVTFIAGRYKDLLSLSDMAIFVPNWEVRFLGNGEKNNDVLVRISSYLYFLSGDVDIKDIQHKEAPAGFAGLGILSRVGILDPYEYEDDEEKEREWNRANEFPDSSSLLTDVMIFLGIIESETVDVIDSYSIYGVPDYGSIALCEHTLHEIIEGSHIYTYKPIDVSVRMIERWDKAMKDAGFDFGLDEFGITTASGVYLGSDTLMYNNDKVTVFFRYVEISAREGVYVVEIKPR